MCPRGKTPGPRERLLDAAEHLLYARGASVGVSAILEEADVARRSLYEHFGGKDGLVAAVLRRATDHDLAWYEQALASGDGRQDRLLTLFDRLDELVADPNFRGCRYLAADLGFADPDHPAHAETETYRRRIRAVLLREVEALGHARPEQAAAELHLLIEGALVMSATQQSERPARIARRLAAMVLDG